MSYKTTRAIKLTTPRRFTLSGLSRVSTAAAIGFCIATGAYAQNIVTDIGASERINIAGQLSTLSQRIIASACNLNSGVTVRESQAVLEISAQQFGVITDALLNGNRRMGVLGEETRPRTLRVMEELNTSWRPLLEQATSTAVAADDNAQIKDLADQSEPLLQTANILVTEITGQYADPVALLQADALLIDLSGRQRTLAAQMSKDVCLIASGINLDQAQTDLARNSKLFSDTLSALRNGMESVGVRPPPTARIEEGLQFVVEEWDAVQPLLAQVQSGAEIDQAARQRLFFAFLGIEARMNNVTILYDKNSKLSL